jgi:hypothetical protein
MLVFHLEIFMVGMISGRRRELPVGIWRGKRVARRDDKMGNNFAVKRFIVWEEGLHFRQGQCSRDIVGVFGGFATAVSVGAGNVMSPSTLWIAIPFLAIPPERYAFAALVSTFGKPIGIPPRPAPNDLVVCRPNSPIGPLELPAKWSPITPISWSNPCDDDEGKLGVRGGFIALFFFFTVGPSEMVSRPKDEPGVGEVGALGGLLLFWDFGGHLGSLEWGTM